MCHCQGGKHSLGDMWSSLAGPPCYSPHPGTTSSQGPTHHTPGSSRVMGLGSSLCVPGGSWGTDPVHLCLALAKVKSRL